MGRKHDRPIVLERWQVDIVSAYPADIRALCCWALDLVEVPWRQSNHKTISVSTRPGVAALDALIGPTC